MYLCPPVERKCIITSYIGTEVPVGFAFLSCANYLTYMYIHIFANHQTESASLPPKEETSAVVETAANSATSPEESGVPASPAKPQNEKQDAKTASQVCTKVSDFFAD
jgi:hypothetical protein